MFIDDNDDDYKDYQKQFRKLSVEITEKKLEEELALVELERKEYELKYEEKLKEFNNKENTLLFLENKLIEDKAAFYRSNMEYLGKKADIDELKYLYESQETHAHEHKFHKNKYEDKFNQELDVLHSLKLVKEDNELEQLSTETQIKKLKEDLKLAGNELNSVLKDVKLVEKKLDLLDRNRMTLANKIGDVVRDLPIIDFMDPYYKVNQIVVSDIKYDVNFAAVPTVDRCTSCHLGIDNPDFKDAEQPFTTHPRLDVFLTSSSPHPMQEHGCTGCHSGRSRGTTFNTAVHMPQNSDQKEEWKDEYDWHQMHHWLKPMLPAQYSQAGCFKCHSNNPSVVNIENAGDKLAHGLALIQKNGCNGCHLMQNFAKREQPGPDLTKIKAKTTKEWAMKWIKDPKSFRHNSKMPSFFGQDNNSDPTSVKRNDTEIFTMVEYLFDSDYEEMKSSDKYMGDEISGEKLFNAVGCAGCHIIAPDKSDLPDINTTYTLLSQQGPNLINLGSKTTSEWVYKWIKDPTSYWPDTKMPDLRLSDQEAKDITSYLMSFKDDDFESIDAPKIDLEELDKIALGWLEKMYPEVEAKDKFNSMQYSEKIDYVADKSIRYYGCTGCHDIPGYEDAKPIGVELTHEGSKPVGKLDFGYIHDIDHTNYAWFEQKLKNPRIFDRNKVVSPEDKLRMPNFHFTDEEIEAIVTAILSFSDDKLSPNIIADRLTSKEALEGHKIIKDLNCQGCHIIEDFGGQIADHIGLVEFSPPNLNTQGDKVHPEWLYSFLKEPTIIRPNLEVRMPSFDLTDEELNAIIAAFQDIDNNTLVFETHQPFSTSSYQYKAGEKLAELGACNNCHFYGEIFPLQGVQTWAPNLAMSKERLKADWLIEWLRDPQAIMPGTKMPAPYLPTSDLLLLSDARETWGDALVKANGDQEIMLQGLRDYIFDIKGKSDISELIKDYFKENGYDFNEGEEEYDDDDW